MASKPACSYSPKNEQSPDELKKGLLTDSPKVNVTGTTDASKTGMDLRGLYAFTGWIKKAFVTDQTALSREFLKNLRNTVLDESRLHHIKDNNRASKIPQKILDLVADRLDKVFPAVSETNKKNVSSSAYITSLVNGCEPPFSGEVVLTALEYIDRIKAKLHESLERLDHLPRENKDFLAPLLNDEGKPSTKRLFLMALASANNWLQADAHKMPYKEIVLMDNHAIWAQQGELERQETDAPTKPEFSELTNRQLSAMELAFLTMLDWRSNVTQLDLVKQIGLLEQEIDPKIQKSHIL